MESRSAKCCCVPIADETVFETWINQVNNPKLSGLTPKQIYNLYRVCEKHFLQADIVNCTKRGLKITGVPMLYLVQDEENKENLPVSSKKQRSDYTYLHLPPGPSKGKTHIEYNFRIFSNMIEDEANILISEGGINYTDHEEVMEKAFGNIRSPCACYNNPVCTHFISSFKTLLINNFLSSHSNCEKDETTKLLDNLKSFLQNTNINSTEVLDDEIKCNIPNNVNQQKKDKSCSLYNKLFCRIFD